jgi:alpha-tubulin suppressor-like RCC1 family protein
MLRPMRGRVGFAVALALTCVAGVTGVASFGVLAACAGIVGVEDVRLRRDSGAADAFVDEPMIDDDSGTIDSAAPPGPNVLEVALGLQHTCARKPAGTVKCWGDDTRGQTGTGGTADGGLVSTPATVAITDALHIASGQNHTCVVRTSGKVSCWGDNQDGQLGNGQTNSRSPTPIDVSGITDARGIACGASFSCALRSSGSVACWGNGLGGQLGNGTKQLQPSPAPVSNLTDAVAISAGESHACAVKAGGTLVCWGDGVNGQLGTGDQNERTTPTLVPSLAGIALVAAGSRSTCAAKKAGNVFCWGANELGQLGSGAANPTPNPSPTAVSGVDAIALWAGADHACAVRRGGPVACWGAGFQGQIGDGQTRATATDPTPSPSAVSGITNAIGVGTGGNHSCAPTSTGGILCWGENAHGEIGNGQSGLSAFSPESVLGYP